MAEMVQDYERIIALIEGYTSGTLNVNTRAELDAWIAERGENKVLFEELTNTENLKQQLILMKRKLIYLKPNELYSKYFSAAYKFFDEQRDLSF